MKTTIKIASALMLAIAAPLGILRAGCLSCWPWSQQPTLVKPFIAPSTSDSEQVLRASGSHIQLSISPAKKHALYLREQRHKQRARLKAKQLNQTPYDSSSDEEGDYLEARITQRRARRIKVKKQRNKQCRYQSKNDVY